MPLGKVLAPPKFFLEPSSALQFPLYTVILLFSQTMKYTNCLQFAAIFVGWRLFIKTLTMSLVIYERRLVVQNNILWGNTNNIAQKQHMHFCTLSSMYFMHFVQWNLHVQPSIISNYLCKTFKSLQSDQSPMVTNLS